MGNVLPSGANSDSSEAPRTLRLLSPSVSEAIERIGVHSPGGGSRREGDDRGEAAEGIVGVVYFVRIYKMNRIERISRGAGERVVGAGDGDAVLELVRQPAVEEGRVGRGSLHGLSLCLPISLRHFRAGVKADFKVRAQL